MPKLNTNNYEVQDFLLEVGKYFVTKFHVDGYRLDVANEVSHNFWTYFKHELRRLDKDLILIGEIWTNSYKYLSSNEFDSVMNYAFLNACKLFFVDKTDDAEAFKNRLENNLMRYDENTNYNMLNLIDSHDTPRFYDYMKPNKDAYLLAELVLVTHIGIPMIYYGDEIFMDGSYDPANRKGMEWDSSIYKTCYFELFNSILNLRKINAFAHGDMKLSSENKLFILERFDENEHYKVVINNTKDIVEYNKKGKIILSNNFNDSYLLPYSFVVIKE